MRVRLLTSRSGDDGSFAPGDVIELGDAEAGRYLAAGLAEEAPAEVAPEAAPAAEEAPAEVAPKPRKRK